VQGKITDFVRPIKATSFEQVDKKPANDVVLRGKVPKKRSQPCNL